ncbi:MAG: hypothetical protein AAGC82_02440 [Pseudomonadota bacterium]
MNFWTAPAAQAAGAVPHPGAADALADLNAAIPALSRDPYLTLADQSLGLISVFDDLKYDRADADMMTPPMRLHAFKRLKPFGFAQVSGAVLRHDPSGISVFLPKSHALGASPFDITRYTPKGPDDFYLLTPTQTACQFIDAYPLEDAVERIKELITTQPINLYRLLDYLDKSPRHRAFETAIGHLKFVQREAVASEPLCRRRALG